MERNVFVVILAVAIASSLSGCGVALKLTHGKSDGNIETVTAVGTQSALLSQENLITKTWKAAAMVCGLDDARRNAWQKEPNEVEKEKSEAATSAGDLVQPQMYGASGLIAALKATETVLASAKGVAEHGVGLLSVFGADSYTITLKCNPTTK